MPKFLKQFAPSVSDSDCTMLAEAKMDVDDGVPVLTVEGPCIDLGGAPVVAVDDPRTEDPPAMVVEAQRAEETPVLTVDDPRAERPAVLAVEAPCVDEGALALAVDPPCISEAQCYAAVRPPHQACDARNGVGREAGNGVAYTAVVYGDAGPLASADPRRDHGRGRSAVERGSSSPRRLVHAAATLPTSMS